MKEEIEKYYWNKAEEFIDMLFDKGYFSEKITRKDMKQVEELLAFLFQSEAKSVKRAAELLRKLAQSSKREE